MTKFADSKFDVAFMGNQQYRDNWNRIFAKCKRCLDAGWIDTLNEAADRSELTRCECNPDTSRGTDITPQYEGSE